MVSVSLMKKLVATVIVTLALVSPSNRSRADYPEEIPFVPTPIEVVDKMLELAEVKKGDVVFVVRVYGFPIDPGKPLDEIQAKEKTLALEILSKL